MWDEIAAIAMVDPSIITKQQELYVNIDIDHGPGYGQTIFVEADMPGQQGQPPADEDGALVAGLHGPVGSDLPRSTTCSSTS